MQVDAERCTFGVNLGEDEFTSEHCVQFIAPLCLSPGIDTARPQ